MASSGNFSIKHRQLIVDNQLDLSNHFNLIFKNWQGKCPRNCMIRIFQRSGVLAVGSDIILRNVTYFDLQTVCWLWLLAARPIRPSGNDTATAAVHRADFPANSDIYSNYASAILWKQLWGWAAFIRRSDWLQHLMVFCSIQLVSENKS